MSAPTTPEELEQLTRKMEAAFVAEESEHGRINIGFLEYLGFEFGRHAALFADEADLWLVTFDEDINVYYVSYLPTRETPTVW